MKTVFSGDIIEVVQFDVTTASGKVKQFERARRAPGVRILIQNEHKEVLLNREYRYELDSFDWRLPGGKVIDSLADYTRLIDSGTDLSGLVLSAAQREAKEEVGVLISDSHIVKKMVCGATIVRDLYYVKVDSYELLPNFMPEDEEADHIEGFHWHSLDEVKVLLSQGAIHEGRTAAVLAELALS